MNNSSQISFPKKFIFGIADADLQVIGEQATIDNENSQPTIWRNFAEQEGRVYKKHSTNEGIDRYHRWKEDIGWINKLGTKHYRTSISMARTLTKDKKVNEKAILWYKNYFSELKKQGIHIYATLYHWELPQYLNEQGGWTNKKTIEYLVEHSKIVYKYLNEYIDEYFILNEPWCSTFFSYHAGDHAPGEKNLKSALESAHNMLLAQGWVYKELRKLDKNIRLSTVYNPVLAYTTNPSSENLAARTYAQGYYADWFLDPLYLGKYPKKMMDVFGYSFPKIEKGDMEVIKIGDKLHSFGVNYYYSALVEFDQNRDVKFKDIVNPKSILNGLDWPTFIPPLYQEGFYDLLMSLYHRYSEFGMKRIYITENGTAWKTKKEKDGTMNDDFRIFYLEKHIQQVHKAICAGVPIEAYFEWTLMDNYEWQFGYMPESCFGLIHIARKTMKRTPKNSYYWYKKIVKSNKLDLK